MRLHDITSSSGVAEKKHCRVGQFWVGGGYNVHMKVSMHTASHIDTRLAVTRVRFRDRVRVRVKVRVRISYSQASREYQPRRAILTATSEASRVYSISRFTSMWLPHEEDVDFRQPKYSQHSNIQL